MLLWWWTPLPVYVQTGFSMEDILRKYIRYALNEKPFNPDIVVDLIHLRKASMLEDAQVAAVLNEVSRRIVKEKGDRYILLLLMIKLPFSWNLQKIMHYSF